MRDSNIICGGNVQEKKEGINASCVNTNRYSGSIVTFGKMIFEIIPLVKFKKKKTNLGLIRYKSS